MDETSYHWLVDFILSNLTTEEKARITAEAEKKYDELAKLVEKYPDMPASIAERALEYYINELAEE